MRLSTFIATRLLEIRNRYGPDSLAFLNSPRCSNEESYLLQKLARAVIGTNNVDHGTGVYGNNSSTSCSTCLAFPRPSNSISELTLSGAIVVDGVDLARRLPTLGGAVLRAKLNGAAAHCDRDPPPSLGGERRCVSANQAGHGSRCSMVPWPRSSSTAG